MALKLTPREELVFQEYENRLLYLAGNLDNFSDAKLEVPSNEMVFEVMQDECSLLVTYHMGNPGHPYTEELSSTAELDQWVAEHQLEGITVKQKINGELRIIDLIHG
jgi:hypothetical protein